MTQQLNGPGKVKLVSNFKIFSIPGQGDAPEQGDAPRQGQGDAPKQGPEQQPMPRRIQINHPSSNSKFFPPIAKFNCAYFVLSDAN